MSSKFPGANISAPATIIAVSGFAGSGKNTVSRLVAQALGWRVVEPTFKTLAQREGITLMEFQQRAHSDYDIDKKFDEALQEQSREGKCVIATWLGPWMAPGKPFRVWLEVPEQVRASRICGREHEGEAQALEHIQRRDADNVERYKNVYGIDITNHSGFDLALDASKKSAQELADEIISAFNANRKV
ncbi:MAG: cytidylate kinase family protein [Candidatus Micrarchaeota archaeon]